MAIGKKLAIVVAAAVALAGGFFVFRLAQDSDPRNRITVAGKQFTEQEVLGEMMAILIESHTDINVVRKLNLGGTMICFEALRSGDVDLYAEYTGTGLVNILDREVIADPDEAYAEVKREFRERWNLAWLEPLGINNTYTLTMRRAHAEELGIETISDLADHIRAGGELKAAFDAEFLIRPDGYPGLSERYGFSFAGRPMQMDPGLMYQAVHREQVDVIDAFATDGRIAAYDLLVLEDDKQFFPPYYAAPLVNGETLERFPELEEILNRLAGRLTDHKMQELNYEVDVEGRRASEVAREFLVSEGLLIPGDDSKLD